MNSILKMNPIKRQNDVNLKIRITFKAFLLRIGELKHFICTYLQCYIHFIKKVDFVFVFFFGEL